MEKRHAAVVAIAGLTMATTGCSRATTTPAPDVPSAMVLEISARPDSVIRLAKFAVMAINGLPQPAKNRGTYTTVATHYTRTRVGGGNTQVAVIAAVEHAVKDARSPLTVVELSAWVLDLPRQITPAQRRAGIPTTAITTDAPGNPRPRAATARDTVDWALLEYVAQAFEQHGARRRP